MPKLNQGITWSKWDLHVHTPSSIHSGYGGDEAAWQKYLEDVEALPKEFKVLGINDYLWLEGYTRMRYEKAKNGRLRNIELLLPVIELRTDDFGGTESSLSRLNFHVIFSPEIEPEIITNQFLNALETNYVLSADGKETWSAVPTRESLADLGRKIKAQMPAGNSSMTGQSDVEVGFANLNFKRDDIKKKLARPHFTGKYLTVIGRTEFWDVKWNQQFIADKKTLINDTDFIFTAAPDIQSFQSAKGKLVASKLNSLLLDCSDAHHHSSSPHKDRLGNCATWLKTEHSFNGLKQIKHEADRIFVGDAPDVLARVNANKTKYIKSLRITKHDKTIKGEVKNLSEPWFDGIDIEFNPELVAIIGNKGNGKTAILDIAALLGNSKCKRFSFLNDERFRSGGNENKAQFFNATLTWCDDKDNAKFLDEKVNSSEVERVKYLPQAHFEDICNSLGDEFENEIKDVIFSYVGDKDRANAKNLDDLLELKSQPANEAIKLLQEGVAKHNVKIVDLEAQRGVKYIAEIEKKIELKKQEIEALEASAPPATPTPEVSNTPAMAGLKTQLDSNSAEIERLDISIAKANKDYSSINSAISVVESQLVTVEKLANDVEAVNKQLSTVLSSYAPEVTSFISLTFDKSQVSKLLIKLRSNLSGLNAELDSSNPLGLIKQLSEARQRQFELTNQLDAPAKDYETYLRAFNKWQNDLIHLKGMDTDAAGHVSLLSLTNDLNYLKNQLPIELGTLKGKRLELAQNIVLHKIKILADYRELYRPVNEQIITKSDNQTVKSIAVDASFSCSQFTDQLFAQVARNTTSGFTGLVEGFQKSQDIVRTTNFENMGVVANFFDSILSQISLTNGYDKDEIDGRHLKKGVSTRQFYNWLFNLDFLDHKYNIKLNGKGLDKLSPGEKGALLIIFYLSLDQSEIPLLIDQPEENLDNQSISAILVPFIKQAKTRRQIIIVTHNPNLAVVCDAEQIIHVKIDKENDNILSVICGAIENTLINPKIVDVLEGTMPAFDIRNLKYDVSRMLPVPSAN